MVDGRRDACAENQKLTTLVTVTGGNK